MELKTMAIGMAVFLMFFNAAPALMMQSGLAEDWGVQPSIGGDDYVEDANNNMSEVKPSGGFASTLFQLYSSVAGTVEALFTIVLGGPLMLSSIGIPNYIIGFVFVPQYAIVGSAMIYVLAGRLL